MEILQTVIEHGLGFFNVPAFWLIMVILASDFLTGTWRAGLEDRFSWLRLWRAPLKFVLYVLIFVPIHAIYMMIPMDLIGFGEMLVLGFLMVKEVISVLQNGSLIATALGFGNPAFTAITTYLNDKVFSGVLERITETLTRPRTPEKTSDHE